MDTVLVVKWLNYEVPLNVLFNYTISVGMSSKTGLCNNRYIL